jgi:hypothetical protein
MTPGSGGGSVDRAKIDGLEKKNKENLKKLKEGQSIPYKLTMMGKVPLLLIGPAHDPFMVGLVEHAKHMKGVITITKGSGLDPGELKVTGNSGRRMEMQTAINKFSKKKITWV